MAILASSARRLSHLRETQSIRAPEAVEDRLRCCIGRLADKRQVSSLRSRKRRGSDTQVRPGDDDVRFLLIVAEAVIGSHARPRRRRRSDTKLSANARAAVRAEKAKGRSLRELALAFGVSHQTISNIFREDSGSQAA